MTRAFMLAVLASFACPLSACSSCSGGGGAGDAGMDSGPDTDADSDSDGDADGGDSDTLPEGFVPDAGPWIWDELPDAGDCGVEGCRQLTFGDEVRFLEWDVWGNLVSFTDADSGSRRAHVVNWETNRTIALPEPFIAETPTYVYSPATIFDFTVCYSEIASSLNGIAAFICADLNNHLQKIVYFRERDGDVYPNPANYIDLYGERAVAMGGCGEVLDSWPLCVFDLNAPGAFEEIAPSFYGYYNSIWENVVVWASEAYDDYDIRGYDFSTEEFIEITDDAQAQMNPRIHGTRVVYQDLKLGDSLPMGDWNHSAIFMYDLVSHETTQITGGEWIAAEPDIHEDIIVWADSRACANPNDKNDTANVEIWGYNLDTETEFQVTNLPGRPKATPRVWGDKVFVHMHKATPGEDAIYMFDLPDGAK